jgi:DNA-binding LacI/PurR family transcriptional regulator
MAPQVESNTGKFLYEKIRDAIRDRIEGGTYTEGARLPSTRDFVDEFNTTPVTVNRALSELVDSRHIYRKAKSGSYVNSRNDWGEVERQRTGLVGIIAFDTNVSIYWTKVVEAMQDALEARGYHAVIGYSDHDYEKAVAYADDLVDKGIDGLIYVPIDDVSRESYQVNNEAVCRRIEELGIPFVLFDRRLKNQRFSSVTADVYRVSRDLTLALAAARCKRPLCLTLDYAQAMWEREQAFLDHGPSAGMEVSEASLVRYRGRRLRPDEAVRLADILDAAGEFDGLFITNSGLYNAFLRMERETGRRYDVPIVTFRDIENEDPDRPIARGLQPVYDFGFAAGDLLARILDDDVPGSAGDSAIHLVLPIPLDQKR